MIKNISRNIIICMMSTFGFIATAMGIVMPLQSYATLLLDASISLSPELGMMISQGKLTFPIVDKYCPIAIPKNRIPVEDMDTLTVSCLTYNYHDLMKTTNGKIGDTMTKYFTLYPDTTKRLKAFKNAVNYATRQRDTTNNTKEKFIYDMIALSFSNAALETSIQVDGGQSRCTVFDISCTDGEIDLSSTNMNRYWKIYSKNYSLSKKSQKSDSITYKICLASNNTICIDLIQYEGTFKEYYTSNVSEDGVFSPSANEQVKGKMKWSCANGMADSRRCYVNTKQGSLIMNISDAKGEGFHGGEYDPKEILKAIGF